MPLQSLDHVNIRTADLDAMIKWYEDILGMPAGPRPDFPFPGAWLYVGDRPAVHLVGVEAAAPEAPKLQLEHFAFGASGFDEFRAHLDARGIAYTIDPVPGYPIVQINLHDCDGNHIHVDFDRAEAAHAI